MQNQQATWLQAAQALGPYVTAIVAIVAAVVTGWLTHRNWLKQFTVQKSFAFDQERIRLLSTIPQKVFTVFRLAQEALVWRCMYEAMAIATRSTARIPDVAKATMRSVSESHSETIARLTPMFDELYAMCIMSKVYFGEITRQALADAVNRLQLIVEPSTSKEYASWRDSMVQNFKKVFDGGVIVEEFIPQLLVEAREQILPALDKMREPLSQTVVRMMERITEGTFLLGANPKGVAGAGH